MAQPIKDSAKAIDSTAGEAITDTQNNKGIKVSTQPDTCFKSQINGSQDKKNELIIDKGGRPPLIIDYDKLTEYASQDITNKEIAGALDMSVASFYNKMKTDENFRQAYEQGMDNRKYELEKALYKRATGYQAEEVVIEKDESGNVVKTKITDKTYVPDTTALIFTLSNIMPDKYKQKGPESKLDVNINVNQINQLSDNELIKIASGAIVDAVDYSIE